MEGGQGKSEREGGDGKGQLKGKAAPCKTHALSHSHYLAGLDAKQSSKDGRAKRREEEKKKKKRERERG